LVYFQWIESKASPPWGGWRGRIETGKDRQIEYNEERPPLSFGRFLHDTPVFILRRCVMTEIKYEIIRKIGVLSTSASGWTKELNLVSWNDREPKYDLRDWSADRQRRGKGVTLSKVELLALKKLLDTIEL
jgi:hypothetical protein